MLSFKPGLDKATQSDNIIKTIERVRQFDFNIGANYIFGLPDDDYKSMRNTIDFAKEITQLQYIGQELGVEVHLTPKCHCE